MGIDATIPVWLGVVVGLIMLFLARMAGTRWSRAIVVGVAVGCVVAGGYVVWWALHNPIQN